MVSTRSSRAAAESPAPDVDTRAASRSSAGTGRPVSTANPLWSHVPSNLTLLWLLISLPLVVWDCGYILGRPHTMSGGSLHWPLWVPYSIYANVDFIYGFPALQSNNGFPGAQASLNVVETLIYLWYLHIIRTHGRPTPSQGRGALAKRTVGWLAEGYRVTGNSAAFAVVAGYSAALMTLSKTVLYMMNEVFSGFRNAGHNDIQTLILCYIIPNGAWLILSGYMTYAFGAELLQGLSLAAGGSLRKRE